MSTDLRSAHSASGLAAAGSAHTPPLRAVAREPLHQSNFLVEMKTAGATVPIKDGIPDAFPREGAFKVMENGRLTAWDYT